jgi:hypothetical protein
MRLPPLPRVKANAPVALVVLGLAWAAVALLDPARPSGRTWGVACAVAGFAAARWSGRRPRLLVPACCLTLTFSIAAFAQPEDLRADSPSYYAYLRSAAFGAGASIMDREALRALGQTHSYVFENGVRYRFGAF